MGIDELRALMGHETIQMTLRSSKVTSRRAEEVAQQAVVMKSQDQCHMAIAIVTASIFEKANGAECNHPDLI